MFSSRCFSPLGTSVPESCCWLAVLALSGRTHGHAGQVGGGPGCRPLGRRLHWSLWDRLHGPGPGHRRLHGAALPGQPDLRTHRLGLSREGRGRGRQRIAWNPPRLRGGCGGEQERGQAHPADDSTVRDRTHDPTPPMLRSRRERRCPWEQPNSKAARRGTDAPMRAPIPIGFAARQPQGHSDEVSLQVRFDGQIGWRGGPIPKERRPFPIDLEWK